MPTLCGLVDKKAYGPRRVTALSSYSLLKFMVPPVGAKRYCCPSIKICKSSKEYMGISFIWASLMAQMVKNPPATRETCIQSLGGEEPLEEGMATHSSVFAERIPRDRGAWWVTDHRVAELGTTKRLSPQASYTFMCWRPWSLLWWLPRQKAYTHLFLRLES